jgi:hypothetical protein
MTRVVIDAWESTLNWDAVSWMIPPFRGVVNFGGQGSHDTPRSRG